MTRDLVALDLPLLQSQLADLLKAGIDSGKLRVHYRHPDGAVATIVPHVGQWQVLANGTQLHGTVGTLENLIRLVAGAGYDTLAAVEGSDTWWDPGALL